MFKDKLTKKEKIFLLSILIVTLILAFIISNKINSIDYNKNFLETQESFNNSKNNKDILEKTNNSSNQYILKGVVPIDKIDLKDCTIEKIAFYQSINNILMVDLCMEKVKEDFKNSEPVKIVSYKSGEIVKLTPKTVYTELTIKYSGDLDLYSNIIFVKAKLKANLTGGYSKELMSGNYENLKTSKRINDNEIVVGFTFDISDFYEAVESLEITELYLSE